MKKLLFVSNITNKITNFSIPSIVAAQNLNYEFHLAADLSGFHDDASKYGIIMHHIDLDRNPFNPKNLKAYKQMLGLMEKEKFDAIHCNTPIGGVLGRLCGKKAGVPTVIYTAHGFHFYNGAPAINWILYYSAELFLSRYTDLIITMNNEDYERAKKSFKNTRVVYIPGVGIDVAEIEIDRGKKRNELGISDNTIALLSVGEMIKRKNYETALMALSKLKNKNYIYLICGSGKLENKLKEMTVKLGLVEKVKFLGFRNDISEICKTSDIFLFPSYQEGLPLAVMEAMAAGLPIICSSIRGNVDLIENGNGGFLHHPNDIDKFSASIENMIDNPYLIKEMGSRNLIEAKKYDVEIVKKKMQEIYKSVLN